MLNILRKKKTAKRIIWVLAVLIIPAFVLWGAGSLGKKQIAGATYAGTIDGRKIDFDDFYKSKKAVKIQMLLSYFADKEMLDRVMEDNELLNNLAWERLMMLDDSKKRRIAVSDNEVIGFITGHPLFMNNGVFDEKFYNYMINKNLGLNTREFEEETRNLLKVMKARNEVLEKISVSDEEALELYREENEKGKVSYIIVEWDKFKKGLSCSDEEIDRYYKENKNKFLVSEMVVIEYSEFSYSGFGEKAAMVENFGKMSKELRDNPDKFNMIAKDYGKDIKILEPFSKESIPSQFSRIKNLFEILSITNIGEVRMVFDESPEGKIYMVRIKEKAPPRTKNKEEVKKEIENIIIEEKSDILAENRANEIYTYLNEKKDTMKTASAKFNEPLKTTDYITRHEYVEGVGDAYGVLDSLFAQKTPDIFKVRKGYLIAQLDDLKEIDPAQFEKAKDEYKNKVLIMKKTGAIESWLTELSKNSTLKVDLTLL